MLGHLTKDFKLENRISVVHKYVYLKIVNKDCKLLKDIPLHQTMIDRICMRRFLSRHMVPVEIQNTFLKEMEAYGLIKIRGKKTIEIMVK